MSILHRSLLAADDVFYMRGLAVRDTISALFIDLLNLLARCRWLSRIFSDLEAVLLDLDLSEDGPLAIRVSFPWNIGNDAAKHASDAPLLLRTALAAWTSMPAMRQAK